MKNYEKTNKGQLHLSKLISSDLRKTNDKNSILNLIRLNKRQETLNISKKTSVLKEQIIVEEKISPIEKFSLGLKKILKCLIIPTKVEVCIDLINKLYKNNYPKLEEEKENITMKETLENLQKITTTDLLEDLENDNEDDNKAIEDTKSEIYLNIKCNLNNVFNNILLFKLSLETLLKVSLSVNSSFNFSISNKAFSLYQVILNHIHKNIQEIEKIKINEDKRYDNKESLVKFGLSQETLNNSDNKSNLLSNLVNTNNSSKFLNSLEVFKIPFILKQKFLTDDSFVFNKYIKEIEASINELPIFPNNKEKELFDKIGCILNDKNLLEKKDISINNENNDLSLKEEQININSINSLNNNYKNKTSQDISKIEFSDDLEMLVNLVYEDDSDLINTLKRMFIVDCIKVINTRKNNLWALTSIKSLLKLAMINSKKFFESQIKELLPLVNDSTTNKIILSSKKHDLLDLGVKDNPLKSVYSVSDARDIKLTNSLSKWEANQLD